MATSTRRRRLELESLEERRNPVNDLGDPDPPLEGSQPSSIYLMLNNTVAVIEGSTLNDKAEASIVGTQLKLQLGHYTSGGTYVLDALEYFTASQIKEVHFLGGNGNDLFTNNTAIVSRADGDSGSDTLNGGSGADKLYGESWDGSGSGVCDDLIDGNGGNDYIVAGVGANIVYGGDGDDIILGGIDNDLLYGDVGSDWLYASNGNDTIYGGSNNDFLFGEIGADNLYGDVGNDYLDGGFDNTIDQLTGGLGMDFFTSHSRYAGMFAILQPETMTDVTAIQGDLMHNQMHEIEVADSRPRMAAYLAGNVLSVIGPYTGDTVSVSSVSLGTWGPHYRVTLNGWSLLYSEASLASSYLSFLGGGGNDALSNSTALRLNANGGAGYDSLNGGSGNDTLSGGMEGDALNGNSGNDSVFGNDGADSLSGSSGDDSLYGGSQMDSLYGGSGLDSLYGDEDRDKLYGGYDFDSLYGGSGNDWLDAGSASEYVAGGVGMDFDAYVWAIDGTNADDVYQGGSPTCWLVASIASVALRGEDLAGRINYLGNDWYSVGLYNGSTLTPYCVRFDGTLFGADANAATEGESWVLLYQRAYLTLKGESLDDPPPGRPEPALEALTGRCSETHDIGWWLWEESATTAAETMRNAILDGKNVALCSKDSVSDPLIRDNHCFTVVNVVYNSTTDTYAITLRDPHGNDSPGTYTEDGVDDGYITIDLDQLDCWFEWYAVN